MPSIAETYHAAGPSDVPMLAVAEAKGEVVDVEEGDNSSDGA